MSAATGGGYLTVLRTSRLGPLFAWACLARLVYGVLPLALLLLIAQRRGSYADAGAVAALNSLAVGVLGPLRAGWLDRFGAARVFPLLALAFGIALTALTLAAAGPLPVTWLLALVAGSLPPPVGPLMRSAWRAALTPRPGGHAGATGAPPGADADHDGRVRRAYALDAVAEELAFIVGPLVAAMAVAMLGPAATLVAFAVVLVIAAFGMVATLPGAAASSPARTAEPAASSEPAPSPERAASSERAASAERAATAEPGASAEPTRLAAPAPASERSAGPAAPRPRPGRPLWRDPRLLSGLVPVAALGFLLGGIDVAAVALAVRTGGEGRAGIPSAAASVGSLLGGLAYGRWRVPGAVRMIVQVRVLVTAAAGLVVLAAVASRWLPVLAAVLMLVGACTGPAIVASYLVADAVLPVGTRATAWVTAAFNVFLAAGTAVAGRLVDVAGPAGGLAAPALFAAVMLLAASLPRPLIARALPYGSRLRSASSDPPERPPSVDAAPTAG